MNPQMAFLIGAVGGIGIFIAATAFLPAHPSLRGALVRMNPDRSTNAAVAGSASEDAKVDAKVKVGVFAEKRLGRWLPLRVPAADLAMLQMTRAQFIGEKVLSGLVAFAMTYVLVALASVVGFAVTPAIPVFGSIAVAVAAFVGPDLDVRKKVRAARDAYREHLSTYIDLVAQERVSGSGAAVALSRAAEVGDSLLFTRLRERLTRARWTGTQPWDELRAFSEEIQVPELAELADTVRLSGEEGSAVYEQLRSQARSQRRARLSDQKANAAAATERMNMPQAMLGLIFLLIVATPAMLRIMTN